MSNWLAQRERLLKITISSIAEDSFILQEFSGKETISAPFNFKLHLISPNTHIAADKIIGKSCSIQLKVEHENPRYFHGIIESFNLGNIIEGVRHYEAQMMPWLNFLNYNSDCRIFQHKSVIDITELLFKEFKFSDYNLQDLSKAYAKLDYCVQYRESTLDFLARLWQRAGIFYFFKHEKSKHILILADKTAAYKKCAAEVELQKGTDTGLGIKNWQRQYRFYSGGYAQQDFNFTAPDTSLYTEQASTPKLALAQKYKKYDYPGHYSTHAEGKDLTQQQFTAYESHFDTVHGSSNYASFCAGGKFDLNTAASEQDNGEYALSCVEHHAYDASYLHEKEAGNSFYRNKFYGSSALNLFFPSKKPAKTHINHPQSATVTGPAGEEIYSDRYGRVRVQFHWDRQGKKDENSSCWLRVAQVWAGQNWGAQFLPRVGQEVIVQFLDGDPDRPIITGSLYNANNLPPFSLPFSQTQSGFSSRSSKGGSAENANILRFDDKQGAEEFFIQAEKDFNQNIKNDLTAKVGNQCTLKAENEITLQVASNSLVINSNGIFLNGDKVDINSKS